MKGKRLRRLRERTGVRDDKDKVKEGMDYGMICNYFAFSLILQ